MLPRPTLYRLREQAYDAIYVSPHLDDAVYSCGGQIASARTQGARMLIVTLFGSGSEEVRSDGTVFGNYPIRTQEEARASELLDVDYLWLNAPDLLARKKRPADLLRYALPHLHLPEGELRRELRATVGAIAEAWLAARGVLYFPLAIGAHPDHREAHELGRALHAETPQRVAFYEDLPYAHVAALRAQRLAHLGLDHGRRASLWREAGQIAGFVFAHQSAAVRGLLRPLVALQLATVGALAPFATAPHKAMLEERDIAAVVDRKLAAMQAYATQTAYFYGDPEALRSAVATVERVWTLAVSAPGTPSEPTLVAQKRAMLEALRSLG